MKKKDWEYLVNLQDTLVQTWNWTDWIFFIVSVVSPIIMLISVIFAWKATKIAKKSIEKNWEMFEKQLEVSKESIETNLEMFEKQLSDIEQSFMPIFEVDIEQLSDYIIKLKIINKNDKIISWTRVGSTEVHEKIIVCKPNDSERIMTITGNFVGKEVLKIFLDYTTLNHRNHRIDMDIHLTEGVFKAVTDSN